MGSRGMSFRSLRKKRAYCSVNCLVICFRVRPMKSGFLPAYFLGRPQRREEERDKTL